MINKQIQKLICSHYFLQSIMIILIVGIIIPKMHAALSSPCASLCKVCVAQGTASQTCNECAQFASFGSGYTSGTYGNSARCTCSQGFSQTSDDKCVLCHTSCKTCSGSSYTQCVDCVQYFTFKDSLCVAPIQDQETIDYQFNGLGFQTVPSWTGGTVQTCNGYTYLAETTTSTISTSYTRLHYYYKIQVLFNLFFIDSGSTASITVTIGSKVHTVTKSSTVSHQCGDSSIEQAFQQVRLIFYHKDITPQTTNPTVSNTSPTITFKGSSDAVKWGIRNYYFINVICDSECSGCYGIASVITNKCFTCVDEDKISVVGNCKCDVAPTLGDPKYEYQSKCVKRCPSLPVKTYGNPYTRQCQTSCDSDPHAPDYYTQDYDNNCVVSCKTGTTPPLYHDTQNKMCVQNCPSTKKYKYDNDKTCYDKCPSNYYASDVDYNCLAKCPGGGTSGYNTFAYNDSTRQGVCLEKCPEKYFANVDASDPTIRLCVTTCVNDKWKDEALGYGRCVDECPGPEWFGDNLTDNRRCVKKCSGDNFGSVIGSRACVDTCPNDSSTVYFGDKGDFICKKVCPDQSWGQESVNLCLTDPKQCLTYNKYADNVSHLCRPSNQCALVSLAPTAFGDPVTGLCVFSCHNQTDTYYAQQSNRMCVTSCTTEFGDKGINYCVQECFTAQTFKDVNSDRRCVQVCNNTLSAQYADNSTRSCVTTCPSNTFADPITKTCALHCTSDPIHYADSSDPSNKTCVTTCPDNFFADNSTGTGLCVAECPTVPQLYGDTSTWRCVQICPESESTFGNPDSSATPKRRCVTQCPDPYFAQDSNQRMCVKECNETSYANIDSGNVRKCQTQPSNCNSGKFGDLYSNQCVDGNILQQVCPQANSTWGNPVNSKCQYQCPDQYYADPDQNRQCVQTCQSLFGNNGTNTCENPCIDLNAWADQRDSKRRCVAKCSNTTTQAYYANTFTKVCVLPTACQTDYYGENTSQLCKYGKIFQQECPTSTFGHPEKRICIQTCDQTAGGKQLYGDSSTGFRICVQKCPDVPQLYAQIQNKLCVSTCLDQTSSGKPKYGQPLDRQCVTLCPENYFSYSINRTCLLKCLDGWYGDDTSTVRTCYNQTQDCKISTRFADPTTNLCVHPCPDPINSNYDLFGDNDTGACIDFCINGFANPWNTDRYCVDRCPDATTFGDPQTRRCEKRCVKQNTWADSQTQLCQSQCSQSPNPTYSQNFDYTCVLSSACPDDPQKLYGQNHTRTCTDSCWYEPSWNSSFKSYAQNTTRMCVERCFGQDGDSEISFGTTYTGSSLCVSTCPPVPRQFGDFTTNLCVTQCPSPTYGDQTNDRRCVQDCPNDTNANPSGKWFAQQNQRVCVQVCEQGNWGSLHDNKCKTNQSQCYNQGHSQFAQNFTNMCVATCPLQHNLFGDSTTYYCVDTCPDTPSIYYADSSNRLCVTICNSTDGPHGTWGDPTERRCVQKCINQNYYADPHNNRSCQQSCSQNVQTQYADPLSRRCVSECPTFPLLFADTTNNKCVNASDCPTGQFGNSVNRSCVSSCPIYVWAQGKMCVKQCPIGMYAQGSAVNSTCKTSCSGSTYKKQEGRICVSDCLPDVAQDNECKKFCKQNYFAKLDGTCVEVANCDTDHFGYIPTTRCVPTCLGGTYSDNTSRLCVQICPEGRFGQGTKCVQDCSSGLADPTTNKCISDCARNTYSNGTNCIQNCTGSLYADDSTWTCVSDCPSSQSTFKDSTTNKCVQICPTNYYRNPLNGECNQECTGGRFADNISLNCVETCPEDNNLFGETTNYTCVQTCPSGQYSHSTLQKCYLPINCPASTYADNHSQSCRLTCHPGTYAFQTQKTCVSQCPHTSTKYFADPTTNKCQTDCQGDYYFADQLTWTCVLICPASQPTYGSAKKCVSQCGTGKFADNTSQLCVQKCPVKANTYGFYNVSNSDRICLNPCPTNFYADPADRQCKSDCPVQANVANQLFAENNTNFCVKECQKDFYADLDSKKCVSSCSGITYKYADPSTGKCVQTCPIIPEYYADNNLCVKICPSDEYADPQDRKCVDKCLQGYYGNPKSKLCQTSCPNGYYGQNDTNLCQQSCTSGFQDNSTNICVSNCPASKNTFADSLNHKCVLVCTGNQFADDTSRTCQTSCGTRFADNMTKSCVDQCPAFDRSFGQKVSFTCVHNCPTSPKTFAYQTSRLCQSICPSPTFEDSSTYRCVNKCPIQDDSFGQISTSTKRQCVKVCQDGLYSDNTTRLCVNQCPQHPPLWGLANTLNLCVSHCPDGLFADNHTRTCVTKCSSSPIQTYGDSTTNRCVQMCPQNYFANNNTAENRLCVTICPSSPDYYGNPVNRKCVLNCPIYGSILLYADVENSQRQCVSVCKDGTFGQNDTQRCVNKCPSSPLSWAHNQTKICIDRCPHQTSYGQNTSRICVAKCPSPLFGNLDSASCVSSCEPNGGVVTYKDMSTRTCVQICPISQQTFADTNALSCVLQCPTDFYADNSTRLCVQDCPSHPAYFKFNYGVGSGGRKCIPHCPDGYFAHNTSRACLQSCDNNLYADQSTNACVSSCPTNPWTYGSDSSPIGYKCVSECPSSPDYYGDNSTQTCVSKCPEENNTWADLSLRVCVSFCPLNSFGVNSSRRCQSGCPLDEYGQSNRRLCLSQCPGDPPKYLQTNSRMCVQQCPTSPKSYSLDLNYICVYVTGSSSGCPTDWFANTHTNSCVRFCPPGQFAENTTHYCVTDCPSPGFADSTTRRCVAQCPSQPDLYAQTNTRTCVAKCDASHGTFSSYNERLCVSKCPTSYYADQTTRRCLQNCSYEPPRYADNHSTSCVAKCPLDTGVDKFAQEDSRQCVDQCPDGQFADSSSRRCVDVCPESQQTYARNDTKRCVKQCPPNSFADNSTRICVSKCPKIPNYFGDKSSWKCVLRCSDIGNTYADQQSRQCLQSCPDGTYAEQQSRKCLIECPPNKNFYADDTQKACIAVCNATSQTFSSDYSKRCVTQCPDAPVMTYAQNKSHHCMQVCPNDQYGQNSTKKCVSKCFIISTGSQYADDISHLCVSTCPVGYYAMESSLKCLSTCPPNSYADPFSHMCVDACPKSKERFGDNSTWKCVEQCPGSTYSDRDSMMCISLCDLKSKYFAFQSNNSCVQECPPPFWGYVPYKTCISECPTGQYPDGKDRICHDCPSECITCISYQKCLKCKTNYNNFNGQCTNICAFNSSVATYENTISHVCVLAYQCPPETFGNNETITCSSTCPTKQYGNQTTKRCQKCTVTCSTCTSSKICSACQSNAILAEDKMCYAYCSTGASKYYYQGTCVQVCPQGTYLGPDLVSCEACSSVCRSCQGSPSRCVLCAGTFKYNETCQGSCPQGWFGNEFLVCQECTQQIPQCIQPLTFKAKTVIEDYKYAIVLQFNKNITLKKQMENILRINLKLKRRAVTTLSQLINQGVNYTVQLQPDGSYKLFLDIDIDLLDNPEFQITITDPSSIVDAATGGTLQQTKGSFDYQKIIFYDVKSTKASSSFVIGPILTVILLIGVFVMVVWNVRTVMYILQVWQILNMLAYINYLIPPKLLYLLDGLKWAHFTFLPNPFAQAFPDNYQLEAQQRIKDLNSDGNFLRNNGYIFVVFLIYLTVFLVLKLLTFKKIVSSKRVRKYCQLMIQRRFKLQVFIQLTWFAYYRVLLFGFWQFYDVSNSKAVNPVSIVIGSLVLTVYIGLPIWWLHSLHVSQKVPVGLLVNSQLQKVEELSVMRKYMLIFEYLRKILIVVLVVSMFSRPGQMLIMMVIVNFLFLILWAGARVQRRVPYVLRILSQVMLLCIIISMAVLVYLSEKQVLSTTQKQLYAEIQLNIIIAYLVFLLIWLFVRIFIDMIHLWASFQKTPFYKQYIEIDEKKLQGFNYDQSAQEDKMEVVQIQPEQQNQICNQIIEKVYREMDENGRVKIRIKKKKKVKKSQKYKNSGYQPLHVLHELSDQEEHKQNIPVKRLQLSQISVKQRPQSVEKVWKSQSQSQLYSTPVIQFKQVQLVKQQSVRKQSDQENNKWGDEQYVQLQRKADDVPKFQKQSNKEDQEQKFVPIYQHKEDIQIDVKQQNIQEKEQPTLQNKGKQIQSNKPATNNFWNDLFVQEIQKQDQNQSDIIDLQ